MPSFKNIILTTDMSENATAAIPYAMELARQSSATVRVLYVFEDILHEFGSFADASMSYDPQAWLNATLAYREKQLHELVARIPRLENVKLVPVLLNGYASQQIVTLAAETQADCVVIATHGRSGFAHFLYGSVAEKVVRMCPCPVLTVRPKTVVRGDGKP